MTKKETFRVVQTHELQKADFINTIKDVLMDNLTVEVNFDRDNKNKTLEISVQLLLDDVEIYRSQDRLSLAEVH